MAHSASRTAKIAGLIIGLALVSQAHVGSRDIFLDSQAGPYKLFVTIRPPEVIPGIAEIEVRTQSPGVQEVLAVPVPLNPAGARFAPVPDKLKVSAQDPQDFSGSLWLMVTGSWQVRIKVQGHDGPGAVAVPVPAYALTTKPMQPALAAELLLMLLLLSASVVLIVGAAMRESRLSPGLKSSDEEVRRSHRAMGVSAAVVAVVLGLGYWWWHDAEGDYRQQIYKPLNMAASLTAQGSLILRLSEPGWLSRPGQKTPVSPALFVRGTDDLVPDHNHLMHLYAIRQPDMDAVYHLHPQLVEPGTFKLALPEMKPGSYRLYADIVHANGFPETPVAQIQISESLRGRPLEGDDASGSAIPWQRATINNASFSFSDGYKMEWVQAPSLIRARTGMIFRFRLVDPAGEAPKNIQFYMGMLGHAAFVKTDGTTFAHIHPTGSVAMASFMMAESQLSTDRANGSDTAGMDMAGMNMPDISMTATHLPDEVSFPYGFPTAGRYRIFVQMKHDATIETGVFDVEVR